MNGGRMPSLRRGIFLGLVTGCVLALTPALATAATGSGICRGSCVASGGGMGYRVTSYYHFTASDGLLLTAVGYTITNGSSRSHVFAPLPGGFTAVATDGSYIQVEDYIGGAGPNCYSPEAITPGATYPDPDSYTIKPRQARKMKLMCFVVPAGEKLAKVQFADNDATSNAVVKLGRASAPYGWPLPNPCKLPRSVTRPLKVHDGYISFTGNPGTPEAETGCTFLYDYVNEVDLSDFLGYGPEPAPRGRFVRIKGWPGGELFGGKQETNPVESPQPYWPTAFMFKRTFRGHPVYGEIFFLLGPSCKVSPNFFAFARAVYRLFGPGPSVPVPSKSINLC